MLKLPVKYPTVNENIDLSEYAKKSDIDAIDASLDNKAEKKDVEELSSQLDNSNAEVAAARNGFETLGKRLDGVDSQLDTKANKDDVAKISSGTPLFASSTNEMTDTTKNYVNTTDGYLYIYSGGSWVNSNVKYQSSGVNDNEITLKKINGSVVNLLNVEFQSVPNTLKTGYYNINSQTIKTDANWLRYCEIECKENEIYRLSGMINETSTALCCFVTDNNSLIEAHFKGSGVNTFYENVEVVVPTGCTKMIFTRLNNGDYYIKKVVQLDYVDDNSLTLKKFSSNLNNDLNVFYYSLGGQTFKQGFINKNTSEVNNSYEYTKYCTIDVIEGEKYRATGTYNGAVISFIEFLNSDNKVVKYLLDGTTSNQTVTNYEFSIPTGVSKMVLTITNSSTNFSIEKLRTRRDVLDGMKIVFEGDSITYGASNGGGWTKYVKENNPYCTVVNKAVPGTTMNTSQPNSILSRIEAMTDDLDYFIMQGIVNDMWQVATLGKMSDKFEGDVLDTTTVYGAFEQAIRTVLSKYKGKKIGVIINYMCGIYTQSQQWSYFKVMKDVCEKYGVKYLDLFHTSGFNLMLTEHQAYYTVDGDKIHINDIGYKIIDNKVENFIKSL